jgi:hypothetical protein
MRQSERTYNASKHRPRNVPAEAYVIDRTGDGYDIGWLYEL